MAGAGGLPYPLHPRASVPAAATPPAPSRMPTVEMPNSFPELRDKSESELRDLLNNDHRLSEITEKSTQIERLRKERKDAVAMALKLARENLSHFLDLEQAKESLLAAVDRLNLSRQALESSMNQLESAKREYSQDWLVTNLKVAASESEEKANDVITNQLLGTPSADIDIDDILKQFIEHKKQYYLRRFKEEKLVVGNVM